MHPIFPCLCSIVILGWTMPVGGSESSLDHERLKPLAWQIGDWVCEYQSSADSGGITLSGTYL